MTTNLPAKLKAADLGRFATRAAQLETAKPAISYWCEYWIVNQLLAKQLHSIDSECLQYTTNLMDKLEQTKTKYADDEAIIDDAAGQAYVEQFGLDTFQRADRAVQANKVTRQTADTFLAAVTFLELLNIWGTPSPDILSKTKYAKWNAVRIVKALKEGKDPNESNPHPEPELELEEDLAPLDPNDPEVQALGGFQSGPHQPSVEEVPDEQDNIQARLAAQSTQNYSLHPSQQPSAQPSPGPSPIKQGENHPAGTSASVSPLEETPNPRNGSVGGGYFPEVPSDLSGAPPELPSAPAGFAPDLPSPSQPPHPGHLNKDSTDFISFPPPPTAPDDLPSTPQDFYTSALQPPPAPPQAPIQSPVQPPQYFAPPPTQYNPPPPTTIAPPNYPPQPAQASTYIARPDAKEVYTTDDMAVAKAQKHCKWAISALNFEDAETAVKELRAALVTLGARV